MYLCVLLIAKPIILMKKTFVSSIMLLAAAVQSIFAVPARPGVVKTVTQPDGSTLEVMVVGDEFRHCYLTVDRIPLMRDTEGRFCYATVDITGHAVPSQFQARDAAMRTGVEKTFVASLDTQLIGSRLFERGSMLKKSSANISAGIGLDPDDTCFPHEGDVHALVLLVEYSDVKFKVADPADYYNRFLNEEGFSDHNGTGSCRDYFMSVSTGKFRPTFDAVGPITLSRSMSYYGGNDIWGNDNNPEKMVIDACKLIDDDIDFRDYDIDGDGEVDNIYIIYAGKGEASYGTESSVWPHRWTLDAAGASLRLDGVKINNYGCCNEWDDIRPSGIGTFCHEFGHVMGLPDLYSTDYGGAERLTPDSYDVMDRGSYNNDGRTPPSYSAFERNAMGWIDLQVIDGPDAITLENINDSNTACIIPTGDKNEFFLLENRQLTGWDSHIPGHGMLIWHIDFDLSVWKNNTVNNDVNHQYVDIVEAGGRANSSNAAVLKSYPFPGTSRNTEFTDDSTPAMRTWAGAGLGLPITEIVEADGVISFNVAGGYVDLDVPQPVATSVNPGGFTLSWGAVEKALSYTVDIYAKDDTGNVLPTRFSDYSTKSTSVTVDRLAPATRYYATVSAHRGAFSSETSGEIEVLTGDADFTFAVPVVREAVSVSANGFTAVWDPVDEASGYFLTVEALRSIEPEDHKADFGTVTTSAAIPAGWEASSTKTYASSGYFGQSAPSLRFDTHGYYLATPVFDDDIMSYEFWARATGMTTDNYLEIEARAGADADWVLLDKANVLNSATGETVRSSSIPEGMRQLRITFCKNVNGNMAVDDVCVTTGGDKLFVLDGYSPKEVGNVTSYSLSGLDPGVKEYSYTVQAFAADGRKSLVSDPMKVYVAEHMGVSDGIATPVDLSVELYDLQGRRVTGDPTPGIYVRRSSSHTEKVYIR